MAKHITPVVPSMPALSEVQDPAVRRVLQSFQDGWTTRNGRTTERFITAAELKNMAVDIVSQGLSHAAGNQGNGGGSIGGGDQSVGEIIDGIEALIKESWLWQHLGKQITWLSEQNNLSVARIASLGEGIISERIERIEGNTKLISTMDAIKVIVDNNSAAIMNEQEVRASSDSAMAKAINTMWAAAGANNALIQNGDHIEVNFNAAQANKWSQLQTEVFGANGQSIRQALAQESNLRSNADGTLFAQYSVKIDQNGYVSGFGLSSESNNGTPVSSFFIRADRFAIGSPQQTKTGDPLNPPVNNMPFIVADGQVHIRSACIEFAGIDSAHIKEAAIKSAHIEDLAVQSGHIQDLSVDTFKIAGNAVTITRYQSVSHYTLIPFSQHQAFRGVSISLYYKTPPQGAVVIVNLMVSRVNTELIYGMAPVWCQLNCNGVQIGIKAATPGAWINNSLVYVFYHNNPSQGNANYEVLVSGTQAGESAYLTEANMTIIGALR